MVSVRRPASKKKASSVFTIRNVILLFIVAQSIILMTKIARKSGDADAVRRRPDILIQKDESRLEDPHEKHTDHDHHLPPDNPVPQQQHQRQQQHIDSHEEELPEPPNSSDEDHHFHEGGLPEKESHKDEENQSHEEPAIESDQHDSTEEGTKDEGEHADTESHMDDEKKSQEEPAVVQDDHSVRHDKDKKDEKPQTNNKGDEVLAKHGTGPTKVGYVVDLVYERMHATFRQETVPEPVTKTEVSSLVEGASVLPCEYLQGKKLLQHAVCRDKDTPLIAYNTAPFARSVCGHLVEPGEAVKLQEYCEEPVHLFPNEQDPPISGKGMPPIVVQSKPGMTKDPQLNSLADITCDIPCKFESGINDALERYIQGTDWKIIQTMQDPYLVTQAKVERTANRKDVYYSTTSFKSSVPLSFYSFDKYDLRKIPVLKFADLQPKATYLLDTLCTNSPIRRQKWYAAVESKIPTESYGSCSHNTDLAENETVETAEGRIKLMQKNRIALAFEAGTDKDHITPVVWEAIMSGAVPAVLGAANLDQHLPGKAYIHTGSFNTWDKFAEFLKTVTENSAVWDSYHRWKQDKEALAAIDKMYNFTRTSGECRMCRWAYAKKYGLGWDHGQQVVKETYLWRKLCLDESTELASHPFQEMWKGNSADPPGSIKCFDHGTSSETTIQVDGATLKRSIVHHDGVTDIYLKDIQGIKAGESVVLRFKVDVRNTEGAYFRDTHTLVPSARNPLVSSASIQDERSKVTVLANWETRVASPQEGVIEIDVQGTTSADEVRRIRVIGEDMSELHDKMTEYFPSSFGKMMVFDFVEPLDMYYVGTTSSTK